jgi:COP9 signalosome complex subunit 6
MAEAQFGRYSQASIKVKKHPADARAFITTRLFLTLLAVNSKFHTSSASDIMQVDGSGAEESKNSSPTPQQSQLKSSSASSAKGQGNRNILLHPLCIITISDQYTRVSTGGGVQPSDSKILGLLFGKQEGLDVIIFDAVEVSYEVSEGGAISLNAASIEKQKELFMAVYPAYDVLGWYSVGEEASAEDVTIQRQMQQYNESPLFLLMNPLAAIGSKTLPVVIHESEVHLVNDQPTLLFVTLGFQLSTSTPEQISLEHVARVTPTDGVSSVELHAAALRTSLRALLSRIAQVREYLKAVQTGQVEPDYGLLRQIAGLTRSKSAGWGSALETDFMSGQCDAMQVSYLAAIQKNTATIAALVDKYAIISMGSGAEGGRRGTRMAY